MNTRTRYTSIEKFRQVYFPRKDEEKDLFDDPTKFGKYLAERHAQMVGDAVKQWAEQLPKHRTKPRTSTSGKRSKRK